MELIVANVGWGVGVLIAYDLHMAMSLPLIIVGEAIVLWGVLPRHSFWRSLWLSLGYSLVMNLFSGLLGLVSGRFWMGLVDPALRVYPSAYYYTPPAGGIETLWFKLTVAFGALSVASEGIILMLLSRFRRRMEKPWPVGRVWLASLVANVVSYVAMFVVYPYVAPEFLWIFR